MKELYYQDLLCWAGERLGFLPGDMKEKVDPYLRPLYDSLYDLFHFEKIQRMIEIGDIEIGSTGIYERKDFKKFIRNIR